MKDVTIVVITGMSGSGKSIALRALEDIGFFCVDNLPVLLLPKLLDLSGTAAEYHKFALVMDIRGPDFLSDYEKVYKTALTEGYNIQTVFLDASDDVLLGRFSDTRRKHPLDRDGDLMESIRRERADFDRLGEISDHRLDTSDMSVHDLRREMRERFGVAGQKSAMKVTLMSFGYKHGIPTDANLIVDVRFLPNPFYIPEMKDRTGLDRTVSDYVLSNEAAQKFLEHYDNLLRFLLPCYEKEGKPYLTIGVGCTGGLHRSVAIVEALAAGLPKDGRKVIVTHRELIRHGFIAQ
jgi:RNase adapter protein RapZ